MSIFYVTVCESVACIQEDYKKLPSKLRNSLPDLMEIKIESISVLVLCVIGFFFMLLNFGNSSRVVTGGISLLLAAVVTVAFIVVYRMGMANATTSKVEAVIDSIWDYDSISMDFPYSLIIATLSIGTSFCGIVLGLCGVLYSKIRRQQTTGGRVQNPFTIFNPNNFTILRESQIT
ncbi:uncharacterized protein LOC134246869 [Saccostrea cucullata]|uniref:uncharacterized protein LOC134246869 n=1 Tax=Saccostrea cuccullata TaxID=36930 RepID=UPI002ED57F3E